MIVINGGTVLTVNDADDVHFGGHVVLDGDRIAAVGTGDYPGGPDAGTEVIDATGMIVMPGLVDLHYHTAIGKGFCDHLPLLESLEEFWYPSIRALDPETAYWAALNSYAESIKNGVTTVNDMYRQLGALGRAAEEIGIRAVLSNDVALPEHNLDTLQDNQDAYDAVHGLGNGRVEVYVGIEWLPLASPELLRDARALADELGTGIHQAPDVLRMATRNGSAALRHDTGQLTPGGKADVILVDTRSPMFTPLRPGDPAHLYSHLVFAADGSAVHTTIVDGRILMRGRQLSTVDEAEVRRQANQALQRIVAAIDYQT